MKATPAPFDEKLIAQYLLGKLPEDKQVEIEDLAFQDQQCMQSILEVESDLIDEYVRGAIPLDKRREFESHFLASAERRRKVEFARALAAVAAENEAPEVVQSVRLKPQRVNPLLAFFRGLSPTGAFAFALAALVLFGGPAWLVRERIRLRSELNMMRADRNAQEDRVRRLEDQIQNERARNHDLTAQLQQKPKEEAVPTPKPEAPAPVNQPTPSGILALTLLPISRAGNAVPTLKVRPDVRTVRLQVGVDPQDDYQHFRASLNTQAGQQVWSQDNLSARTTRAGRSVALTLPARLLAPGRYELSLKGTTAAGASEDVGFYYFEVLK